MFASAKRFFEQLPPRARYLSVGAAALLVGGLAGSRLQDDSTGSHLPFVTVTPNSKSGVWFEEPYEVAISLIAPTPHERLLTWQEFTTSLITAGVTAPPHLSSGRVLMNQKLDGSNNRWTVEFISRSPLPLLATNNVVILANWAAIGEKGTAVNPRSAKTARMLSFRSLTNHLHTIGREPRFVGRLTYEVHTVPRN